MLKAVIFDLDGVIIDSEPMHARAAILALAQFGVTLNIESILDFVGTSDRKMMQTLQHIYQIPASVEELVAAHQAQKKALLAHEGYAPIPHVTHLIHQLSEQGLQLALASSSPMHEILDALEALHIRDCFQVIVSGMELEHPKPAPDIFLAAAARLKVEPSECIVFEDSFVGITAAKAAGMTRIGFLNPHSGKQNLESVDFVIESFEEIDLPFITKVYKRAHGEPVTVMETERLIIRELSVSDIIDMYEIYRSPEVREFIDDIDDYINIEIEKHKAYIKNVYSFYGYGYWGVFSKETGKLIGRCGIQNTEVEGKPEIELGYLLDVNYWGKGYALECAEAVLRYAADELHISRIVAVIDKQNHRSRRVAEALHMHYERDVEKNHRCCDLYVTN